MKIAIVSTMRDYPWGGSEELWASMADEALNNDLHVLISVCNWSSTPFKILKLQQKGAQISKRYLFRASNLRILNRVISHFIFLFRDLFVFNPDVVCISQGATYDFLSIQNLLKSLYAASIPYIIICQMSKDVDIPKEIIRPKAIDFLARAYRVIFVSQHNFKTTERQLAKTLANAIVLRNPVNISDITTLTWPSLETICMASVARLEAAYKGQDILFEVLSYPIWQNRNWRLRLYGEGPDRNYLEALAEYYKISDRVEFLGYKQEVRAIWSKNHLLLLPSRSEGIPLSLVESMLCGRPSVVTDVGGNTEWVEEQETGFIAEAPTTKSFGAALERAWLAQAIWKEMGIKAHEKALTKYDNSPGKSLLKVILDAAE